LSGIPAFALLVWLLPHFGVLAAAWLAAFRVALQVLLLLPGMGRPQGLEINRDRIRIFWLRSKPLLFGAIYFKSEPLIDRLLLSSATGGSLSLYYFAQKIYAAIQQVIHRAILLPVAPRLSIHHKNNDQRTFLHFYRRNLFRVSIVSLLAGSSVLLAGRYLLRFLTDFGNIDESQIDTLYWLLVWLSGMLIGGALGQVCSSTFYARGDTRTPTRLTLVTYTLYMPIKILAFSRWGLQGLAVWCGRFSPVVGIEEPDSLLLDLTGCGELFGGERRLSMRLARALARWGFSENDFPPAPQFHSARRVRDNCCACGAQAARAARRTRP